MQNPGLKIPTTDLYNGGSQDWIRHIETTQNHFNSAQKLPSSGEETINLTSFMSQHTKSNNYQNHRERELLTTVRSFTVIQFITVLHILLLHRRNCELIWLKENTMNCFGDISEYLSSHNPKSPKVERISVIVPIDRTNCDLAESNGAGFDAGENVPIALVYQLHKIPYTFFILDKVVF